MQKKYFILLLISGLFIFAATQKTGPIDALDELVGKFYDYNREYPQQNLYIHTDKPYYLSGDDLFGKVYLTNDGLSSKDILRNKNIYVELINEGNAVVKKTIVNGLDSSYNFSFHLADSLQSGNYILRAYTSWMVGFTNQNIFSKYIHLTKKDSKIASSTTKKDSSFSSVQFLPEGGSLVSDIDNYVAFRAIDKYGRGTDIIGYIKNKKGAIVSTFKSTHLGMGKFSFIPEGQNSYTAHIQLPNKKELTYPLMVADNYAYQLSVTNRTKDQIRIRVALGDSLYKKNVSTYLIATSQGRVCFTSKGTDLYEVNIPLNKFSEGLAQLTLFDSDMKPVSERLIFVQHPGANLNVTTNKPNYGQREKVVLQLKTTDTAGNSIKGMYSVSITDDKVVKYNENDGNIKTHLLLSPYLKGYIEEPGYYFRNEDGKTREDLDLVMLTHGWSRYNWTDIKSHTKINSAIKDNSLSISGTIKTVKNTPAANYTISLIASLNNKYIGTDTTDESGKFNFPGMDFTDTTAFIFQIRNTKGLNEDVNVILDAQNFPLTEVDRSVVPGDLSPEMHSGIKFQVRNNMNDSVTSSGKAGDLKEVVVSSRKKVNYDESKRMSQTSYIIPSDFIEQNGNIELKNILYSVPGVTVFDGHISFYGRNSMVSYSDPMVMLDGVESSISLSISAYDIDFIEILKGGEAAMYGVRGGNGVVLINTKKIRGVETFKQVGIKAFNAPGYQAAKIFYSPGYEAEENNKDNVKDQRVTIYWNGNVATDSKNPSGISFYTADLPTTYTVTVEGIAENGDLIHKTFSINRKK